MERSGSFSSSVIKLSRRRAVLAVPIRVVKGLPAKWGKALEEELCRAMSESKSLEVRRSLEQVIPNWDPASTPQGLRDYRAIEVLERIGNPEAREVLKGLAKGAPTAWRTQEAKRSLVRLSDRCSVTSVTSKNR